jgi:hypothetical protein
MKKGLLLLCSTVFSMSVMAQHRHVTFTQTLHKPQENNENVSLRTASPAQTHHIGNLASRNGSPSINTVSTIQIGTSQNAFTAIGGPHTNVWYDPNINTVCFIHRGRTTLDPTSGYYRYDISKDGGATWTSNLGPVFSDPSGAGNLYRGRYPNGVLYNPPGNTIADSAFLTYYGVNTTTTSDWIAYNHGTAQLGGAMGTVQTIDTFMTHTTFPPFAGSPFGSLTITQSGTVWNINGEEDTTYIGTTPPPIQDYHDNQYIMKGTFNAATKDFNYTNTTLSAPVNIDVASNSHVYITSAIAFDATGNTGYVSVIGNNQDLTLTDAANLMIVYKTIDGGATWNSTCSIMFDNIDSILNLGTNLYETGFEQDAIVDGNGNLHVIVEILPSNASANTIGIPGSGQWGMFDIYTLDGGNSWRAKMLGTPETYRGTYTGAQNVSIDNRGQASKTWSGNKLFFSWGDTDTLTFAGVGNVNPNLHFAGYDVTTNMWAADTNLTANTSGDGICHIFNASNYVIGTTGSYEIPCTIQAVTDPSLAVDHFYVRGLQMDDGMFTVADNSVGLSCFPTAIKQVNAISVNSVYPNPANGKTTIEFTIYNNEKVSFEIVNVLGEKVYSAPLKSFNHGVNKLTFDASKLDAGVYFYSIKTDRGTTSGKLVVE